jgi:valyl-tRNA synthetase
MLAMGEYAMGEVPFPETFLHGLIYGKSYWRERPEGGVIYVSEQERLDYDLGKPIPKEVFSKWEKMSKSKGNIIDPLEMIDQYGTDAVRMALCASATQARQIDLDRRRFEEFKNFANKIWNGARFVLLNLEAHEVQGMPALGANEFALGIDEELFSLEDRWILSTLNRTIQSVNSHLERYEFDQAALEAYDFFWKQFCAYFVEISKPVLFGKGGTTRERTNKQKLLVIVLCQAIRLMHPMAPFITEEIFHILKERLEGVKATHQSDPYTQECIQALHSAACLAAPFPQVLNPADINPEIDRAFALMEQVIYTIRNIRGEMKLSPGTATDVYILGNAEDPEWQIVQNNIHMITALVRTQKIEVQTREPHLGFACTGVYHSLKIILPLPEELLKQELLRLTKEKEKLIASLEKLRMQLDNPDFIHRAPAQLIEKQQQQLTQGEKELEEITRKLHSFS